MAMTTPPLQRLCRLIATPANCYRDRDARCSSTRASTLRMRASFPERRLALVCALLAALALSSLGAAQPVADKVLFDQWASVTEPFPGPATPIGFYSAGCLQGAQALPLDGQHYKTRLASLDRETAQ